MSGGSIEVEVGNKHRMRRLAASNQAWEQNLLRAAPLVGGNGIRIADNLFDLLRQSLALVVDDSTVNLFIGSVFKIILVPQGKENKDKERKFFV